MVEDPLSEELLRGVFKHGCEIVVRAKEGKLVFDAKDPEPEPKPEPEPAGANGGKE